MKLLIDTHLLIWAADNGARLPPKARILMADPENALFFSVASLWEIAIKNGFNRADFHVDARLFRRGLIDNGYHELAILGTHIMAIDVLPPIHKDPFDRLLIAQAIVEDTILLTNDPLVAQYHDLVRLA